MASLVSFPSDRPGTSTPWRRSEYWPRRSIGAHRLLEVALIKAARSAHAGLDDRADDFAQKALDACREAGDGDGEQIDIAKAHSPGAFGIRPEEYYL